MGKYDGVLQGRELALDSLASKVWADGPHASTAPCLEGLGFGGLGFRTFGFEKLDLTGPGTVFTGLTDAPSRASASVPINPEVFLHFRLLSGCGLRCKGVITA